ncbi:MAG TPA: DUF6252 family protein [Candidatus Kapabacteria bacterium]|nr:DUF6252 family protein [Candidatus Kapabacteria bacterium]
MMFSYRSFFAFLFLTFVVSCSNNSSNNNVVYSPVGMSDTMNGKYWSATIVLARHAEEGTVHLSGANSADSLVLSFDGAIGGVNGYTGDVPIEEALYQNSQYLDTVNGTLHISINTSSHIEGTFVLHGADFQNQNPITISGGKFSANF